MPNTERSRELLNGEYYNVNVRSMEYYGSEHHDREYVATTTTYLFGDEKYEQSEPLFIPKIFRISLEPKNRIIKKINLEDNDFFAWGDSEEIKQTKYETVFLDSFSANIPLKDENGEYIYYDKREFNYFENLFVMGVQRQGFRYELNIPALMEKVALMLAEQTNFTDDEIVEAIGEMMRRKGEHSIFKTLQ